MMAFLLLVVKTVGREITLKLPVACSIRTIAAREFPAAEINIRSARSSIRELPEIKKIGGIKNVTTSHIAFRISYQWQRGTRIPRSKNGTFLVVPPKIIDPKLIVLAELKFADHGAQGHLRRLYIHLVENLHHFHDDLPITQDNDRVGTLIGDDLRVANRDGFGRCINSLRGQFL